MWWTRRDGPGASDVSEHSTHAAPSNASDPLCDASFTSCIDFLPLQAKEHP
jgi:hypothetical protein